MMNNGGFDLWYQVRRLADLDPIQIDGWVFRLHYWVTSTAIFAASAVAFAKQYFGDPINCQTSSGIESKVLDDYCWIHSTFHIRNSVVMNSNIPPNIIPKYMKFWKIGP